MNALMYSRTSTANISFLHSEANRPFNEHHIRRGDNAAATNECVWGNVLI